MHFQLHLAPYYKKICYIYDSLQKYVELMQQDLPQFQT